MSAGESPLVGDYAIGSKVWPGLSKLIEEAGEVQQVAGKLMGSGGSLDHWSGDLGVKLIEELGDLQAAIDFFIVANTLSQAEISDRRAMKYRMFNQWHRLGSTL